MKRLYSGVAIAAVVALNGWAHAAPPTVTPSPGYDARLREQRTGPTVVEPVVSEPRPVSRRRVKRLHDGAH